MINQEQRYNYCPFCGFKLNKHFNRQINYCSNCGKKLNDNIRKFSNKVQCAVCHQYVWHGRVDAIECSFCGSKYHYKCVVNWLNTYNSCPLCQNVFIKPKEPNLKVGY